MRSFITVVCLMLFLAVPVDGESYQPPSAPDTAMDLMPDQTDSFGDGLCHIIRTAIGKLHPGLVQTGKICVGVVAVAVLIGVLTSVAGQNKQVLELVGVVTVSLLMYGSADSLIQLATDTVYEINQYGKLMLPVMTAALAAQGGVTKSATLYTATVFLDSVLSTAISELLVPALHICLAVAIVSSICNQQMLKDLFASVKSCTTWGLKTVLYVFTGYISITGVVSGTTDATALRATKLTVSGMVPVVGGIISDASDAILVGAGLVKNSVGVYGLLVIAALWIRPFLQIGIQYLLLKFSGSICKSFGTDGIASVVKGFSDVMGMLLAMVGTVSLILMISLICFMQGVG